MLNKKILFIGLLVFYFVQFFAPNKPIYFLSYFAALPFYYFFTGNILRSLSYLIILSLFSEVGIGASLFAMEPAFANPDTGWLISPMTILLFVSVPFILQNKSKFQLPDLLAVIFLFWNFITLFFNPFDNVLYGIIRTGEVVLIYFILRMVLEKKDEENIYYLLISMLGFLTVLALLQFIFQRNIGLVVESVNIYYPYGLTALENINLFRVTGGSGHANLFAIVLMSLLPLTLTSEKIWIIILSGMGLTVLVLTHSRAAWLIGLIIFLSMLIVGRKKNFRKNGATFTKYFRLSYYLLLIMMLLPYILVRLITIPVAFEEWGSFGVRSKIWSEALNLINQNPLIGVGINRFQQMASENPVTDIFSRSGFTQATKIHNLFIEIATETGLAGLFIFLAYLISIYVCYIRNKSSIQDGIKLKRISVYSLTGLILISLFHPFFQTPQFRLIFLYAAIILI